MDNYFKALLIIILGAFLYLFYEYSNNNRFYYIDELSSTKDQFLLDTRTGKMYIHIGPRDSDEDNNQKKDRIYVLHDIPNGITKRIETEKIKSPDDGNKKP